MTELIAGVDEVGRGSLAGPVIASAVILKNKIAGLDDSKKLSKTKREQLNQKIIEKLSMLWVISLINLLVIFSKSLFGLDG